MEGREEVLGDHLRKHLAGGFLGNVDFVDKIYGGNVGEYLPSKITLSHSLPKVSLISSKLKPVRSFLHSGFTLSIAITTC